MKGCRNAAVKVDATLQRNLAVWRQTAAQHPAQTPLTLPTKARAISPPFSIYPMSLLQEIERVRRWMEGAARTGPFGNQFARKPFRPDTIGHNLKYIR
jgi:hypothetical protein